MISSRASRSEIVLLSLQARENLADERRDFAPHYSHLLTFSIVPSRSRLTTLLETVQNTLLAEVNTKPDIDHNLYPYDPKPCTVLN